MLISLRRLLEQGPTPGVVGAKAGTKSSDIATLPSPFGMPRADPPTEKDCQYDADLAVPPVPDRDKEIKRYVKRCVARAKEMKS